MSRKKRVAFAVLAIFLAVLVLPVAFYLDKLNIIQYSDGTETGTVEDTEDLSFEVEEQDLEYIEGGYGLPSGEVYYNKNVTNILILGTDERTVGFSDNARSDSMMVMSLNTEKDTIKLVSFERGMGVPVLEGEYEGQWDWLTHCFRYGGADLVMKEIKSAFLLDVDQYIRINFTAFKILVDAVGGVDISLTSAEADYINSSSSATATVTSGENHLDGETALVYARCRKIDSDWGRMGRQRKVVVAAIEQMRTLSVSECNALVNELLSCVQTNLTKAELTALLLEAPDLLSSDNEVETMAIPKTGTYGSMTGMEGRSLFAVDFETNATLLKEFLYDT